METTSERLKRISKMPLSMICRKIYYKINRKKKPLPPGTVYDANINVMNLDNYFTEGKLHFAGDFVPIEKSPVRWFKVYSRGVLLGKAKPGEIDHQNRFPVDVEVPLRRSHDVFEFHLELADSSVVYLGNLELSYLVGLRKFEKELAEKSRDIAVPPADIIYLTQGHRQPDVYLGSTTQGVYKLRQVLADLGIPFENMRTILDFGCGSGRLVRGLYADDPGRELYGADYNETLIAWAKQHLPGGIRFIKNEFDPPLPVEDRKFDLVYLVSVFTHLPLESQYKWLAEFKRILKRDGILVISLHGMAYLPLFRKNDTYTYETLLTTGYVSTDQHPGIKAGSNQFFTAHMPEYACNTIFKDWNILAYLPGGKLRGQLATINSLGFSGIQDIYVLSP